MIRAFTTLAQLALVGVLVWFAYDLWRHRASRRTDLHAHVVDLQERRRRTGVTR